MTNFIVHAPTISRWLFADMSVERLRELQRFAEVGRVSASLIHDISGPLTAAILHLDQEERLGNLLSVRHARRSIRVMERYLEAARQQLCHESPSGSFYVKREIDQVKHILQPLARQQHIKLRFHNRTASRHKLMGDPVKFQRIIANLVTNALDAYPRHQTASGQPLVLVSVSSNGNWLVISVRDWGEGITPSQLPHIFKPFYSTKQKSRAGGGIGLATVKRYVEEGFGGSIMAASPADGGTEFCVKLQSKSSC